MTVQTFNPLKFYCPPNGATPDYISYGNFRSWLAYGMMSCWLSHTADDPNSDCSFPRPWTREDVKELRHNFLSLVETVVGALWKGQYSPGDGEIDGDWQSVIVSSDEEPDGGNGDDVMLTWYVRLDDDSIMLELSCTGGDPTVIWLDYEAIADRNAVLAALTEAEATIDGKVWDELPPLAELQPVS